MANEQNLIPGAHKLTVEEASKGARRSAESKRRKRTIRECLQELLRLDCPDEAMYERLRLLGVDPSVVNAISFAQTTKAIQGDTEAARYVRDSAGEKPTDQLRLDSGPIKAKDLGSLSDDQLAALADQADGDDP